MLDGLAIKLAPCTVLHVQAAKQNPVHDITSCALMVFMPSVHAPVHSHRPLLFYTLMETVTWVAHAKLTSSMGFVRARASGAASYYVRKGEPGAWLGHQDACCYVCSLPSCFACMCMCASPPQWRP